MQVGIPNKMNEKLETIRQACIKANPSILNLEFGCEIKYDGFEGKITNVKEVHPFMVSFDWYDYRGFSSSVYDVYKSGLNILGRKIGLADVLLAIENIDARIKLNRHSSEVKVFASATMFTWDCSKDDLTQQSEETINFLYEVLHE